MSVVLFGLSHKTAPIELRELLVIDERRLPDALAQLVAREPINGGLIISTCNRIEVIASTASPADSAASALNDFVLDFHGCKPEDIERHTYVHSELDAVRHIFRVTASLDSMIVGEPQITGQVKDAFQKAQQAGTVGGELNRLMSRAFAVAKRVRNETAIGQNAVSVSYVAVELARKVFDKLDGSTVMLLGAGEMSELAARHLKNTGASRLLIANRTRENSERLASEMGGESVPFMDFEKRLHDADIVICSTEAPHFLVRNDPVRHALAARRNRPMLFIDISVPRNIDPSISNLDNVFLFDIDDLENVVSFNRTEREREALRAEAIIDSEVKRFAESLGDGGINEVIGAFRREVTLMVQMELDRSRKRLGPLTMDQEEALRTLVNSIVSRLTLPVIKQIRESDDGYSRYIEEWRDLNQRNRQG